MTEDKKEKILIIIESPTKQKTIQKHLPKDKNYKILASFGSIADLSTSGRYRLGVDIEHDFKPNYVLNKDKVEVLRAIIDSAKVSDKILICSDEDREGEFIGYSVAERIKTTQKPIKRIVFPEITATGVKAGLKDERDIDQNMVQSAITRRVLDRIVGYMASPFVISRLEKGLSAGRVQSVALRLVVEREEEIDAFKPEEYWNINAHLNKFADETKIVAKLNMEIKNKEVANTIKKELLNTTYTVSSLKPEVYKRRQPAPLITAKLLSLASSRYHLAATQIMSAAQNLYQEGLITYMRTDSVRQSPEAITMIRDWLQKNHPSFIPSKPNLYKNDDAAQNAHESIRPTDISRLPEPSPTMVTEKVYKLIWEITVASQMTPAIYNVTDVIIKTKEDREFKTKGKILKELGWLAITQQADIQKEDNSDIKLPNLVVGDILNLVSPNITAEQKFTQPPPRYTQASLIEELKKRGIGRPSTYAEIMRKITERDYVFCKGTTFHASARGKKVVALLMKYFDFMEYNYTAEMESKLDEIAAGKTTYLDVIKNFYVPFRDTLDKAYLATLDGNCKKIDETCDKCGSPLSIKKSAFGYFLGCTAYPKCKNTIQIDTAKYGLPEADNQVKAAPEDVKCPNCNGPMTNKVGKYGRYYCCVDYPRCIGTRKIPCGKKCPMCNGDLYQTTFHNPPIIGKVLCCTSFPKCRYLEKLENENIEK